MKFSTEDFSELDRLAGLAHDGDKRAMESLVLNLRPLICSVAIRYDRLKQALFDDLCQEGAIALMSAARTYRANEGFNFFSHARTWVTRSIHDYFSENSRILYLSKGKDVRKAFRNIHKFKECGKSISAAGMERMSKELSVSQESIKVADGYTSSKEVSSSTPISSSLSYGEFSSTIEDMIPGNDSPDKWLELSQETKSNKRILDQILSSLNDREKRIVGSRVLVDSDEKITLEILSLELSVSRERVRQIEKNAIDKMMAAGARLCA